MPSREYNESLVWGWLGLGTWALAIMGALLVIASCGRHGEPKEVLARVAESVITKNAYQDRLKKLTMLTPVDNAQMREALLQAMVDEQVLLIEAERRGLRQEGDFHRRADAIRTDAILDAYRASIVDKRTVVRESDVKAAFVLENEKVSARHLYAPTREKANELYAELKAGATFEELAPTVFKDYRLASSGGYLGYFSWEDMDPSFTAAAQKLKIGETSKPVRTKYGYSIIKVEDRWRKPLLTDTEYAQRRKKLEWVVEHRKRAREIQKLDAETLDQLNIQFNDAVVEQMWMQIQRARADSTDAGLEQRRTPAAPAPSATVATVAGRTWSVKVFQERAAATSVRQRDRIQSVEELKDFIGGLALREVYLDRARRAGFDKDSKVKQTIRRHEESFLIEKMKGLLTEGVRVPMDSLRETYERNREDYVQPPAVKLREITVTSRPQAEHLLQELESGADFATLARRYSIRKWSAERGGEVGYVTAGDLGALADDVFKLAPGAFGGPYMHDEKYYTILEVEDKAPRRPLTFENAVPEIVETLLPVYRQRALVTKLEELRKTVPIDYHRALLGQVGSPL